ncbi:MAG: ABC transporter permease [Candidatus Acidiferrum sp.]
MNRRGKRLLNDLDQEIREHIELATQENLERGMSPEEAYYAALRKFGNVTRVKEDAREVWSIIWAEQFGQDLHFAFRQLRKSRGFAAVVILTLALGIGVNTAVFSVADAVLLKPLRFDDPTSLAVVWEKLAKYDITRNTVSPANFLDWREQNRSFSGMAAFVDQPVNLTGAGRPEQIDVEQVSTNFFSVLGVEPMLGRGFVDGEDQPGKGNVVILSYSLWKSKFAGDPDILGKSIQLNGHANTAVGVMGPDFDWYIREFSFTQQKPQLWAPLEITPTWHDRTKLGRYLRVVARLKPGVSLRQAQAQMDVLATALAARYPAYDKEWGVALVSLRDQLSGAFRPALLILLGAVGFVLLIACANISSLLLSRATGRSREIAIRIALGASRSRIARQLLAESVFLGLIGGTLGTFFAVWATGALLHSAPASLLDFAEASLNWRILTFAASVTLVASLLAGFLPSFLASHGEAALALPEGGRTSSAGRKHLFVRSVFVVAEISLALVLLAGSSLMIESFLRLMNVDSGFQASHLLTFQISLPGTKYDDQARASFFTQLLNNIRGLPGVLSVSADVTPPFSGVGSATDFSIVGELPLPAGEAHGTSVRVIEPDYFHTMGIPLLSGRMFSEREFSQQSNVVIINKALADEYFSGKNPIGQKLIIDMKDENRPDEIIGIVGDVHLSDLASAPSPLAYWPYPEIRYPSMTVLVRAATPPLALVVPIRQILAQLDKDQPMAKIATMDQLVGDSVARSRFTTLLLSCFAGLALVLACIGIYGVMAYTVAQRTREIGIRMALGAQRVDVLRLVVGQGFRLAAIGVIFGVGAALALARLMTTLLYGVSAADPLTFVGVAVLLACVAVLACYIPARRAMRVDPTVALRYE